VLGVPNCHSWAVFPRQKRPSPPPESHARRSTFCVYQFKLCGSRNARLQAGCLTSGHARGGCMEVRQQNRSRSAATPDKHTCAVVHVAAHHRARARRTYTGLCG